MNPIPPTRRPRKPTEEGYILVAVIFMLAILIIAMSVAAPRIAKQIQRDRELETMHRGKQYIRAVKLYYRQFGAYPPSLDALVKTNNIRFLRKKYSDPTTGKDAWKPIQFGQQKTQSMGFFGQPLGIAGSGGIGPSGPNGLAGGSNFGGQGSSGVLGTTGSTDAGGTAAGSTDTSGGAAGGSGSTDGSGGASSSTGSAFGTPGGQNGQPIGGAGIIGFSPMSPKQSIFVYKKKSHYNEWEFFYDPLADQMMMQNGNGGITPPIQGGAPGINPNPGPAPAPAPAPTPETQPQ